MSVDPAVVCARCAAGRGCGAGLFGRRRQPAVIEAKVAAGVTLEAGDRVRLEFLGSELVRAAWLAYGLPLAGVVAAVLVATRIAPGDDLTAVACAALGLLAGAWYGRRSLKRSGCLSRCVPMVAERLAPQRLGDPGRT